MADRVGDCNSKDICLNWGKCLTGGPGGRGGGGGGRGGMTDVAESIRCRWFELN